MTKEITKAYILQQLQDKFKLRELTPEVFSFLETVVPTYDIGPHLTRAYIVYHTVSITSMGSKTFFTVPSNEKWHLHGYNVIFMTGVFTVAGVLVYQTSAADWFYTDLAPAIAASYAVNLPKTLVLEEGDNIGVNVDGYTSTGDLELRLNVTKEEIR